jgi:monoamine oxidase
MNIRRRSSGFRLSSLSTQAHGLVCLCVFVFMIILRRQGVRAVSRSGAAVEAAAVVVTAALPLLRAGDIEFAPPLPAGKSAAMGTIQVALCIYM